MKALRILLVAAVVMLLPTSAFALVMGFNQHIHNNTGQDAYDFHVEGLLKSAIPPVQVEEYVFAVSNIPGFDWEYDQAGSSITHLGGNIYKYSGGWSGDTPVKHCETIHVGKAWDEECNNIFVEVRGWWTDRNGNPITPNAGDPGPTPGTFVSDVPLIGFDVQDLGQPQMLMLQNATTEDIQINSMELAVTDQHIGLRELVEDSPALNTLNWTTVGSADVAPGGDVVLDLDQLDVAIPLDNSELITRGYYEQDGVHYFFAHKHTSHPEPATLVMLASGGLALAGGALIRRRRRKA